MVVVGQVKQAHVGHLQPWPEHNVESDNLQESQEHHDTSSSALCDEDTDNTFHPFIISDNDAIDLGHTTVSRTTTVQLQTTTLLTEEMD